MQLKQEYIAGKSLKQLSAKYDIATGTITKRLLGAGVKMRPRGGHPGRALKCNEHFFDDLLQEHPAYWLGFIMADGSIRRKKPSYSGELSIIIKDEGHLEKFVNAIGFQGNVLTTTNDRFYVRITSEPIYQRLVSLGVNPSTKSYTLKFPSYVPDISMRHFLRGYLDGDGGLYICPGKYKMPEFHISVASTEHFLRGFQSEFTSRLSTGGCLHNIRDNAAWRLVYGGRLQCIKIAHFLYADCTIALDRKLVRAQEIMAYSMP